MVAFLLFLLLVGGGVPTEALNLDDASKALFGFAGMVFGAVAAFLGVEASGR